MVKGSFINAGPVFMLWHRVTCPALQNSMSLTDAVLHKGIHIDWDPLNTSNRSGQVSVRLVVEKCTQHEQPCLLS